MGSIHGRLGADDSSNGVPIAQAFGEDGQIRFDVQAQVCSTKVTAETDCDLVEAQQRPHLMRLLANMFQETWFGVDIAAGFHHHRSQIAAMLSNDCIERMAVIEWKGHGGAAQFARYTQWIESGKQVASQSFMVA